MGFRYRSTVSSRTSRFASLDLTNSVLPSPDLLLIGIWTSSLLWASRAKWKSWLKSKIILVLRHHSPRCWINSASIDYLPRCFLLRSCFRSWCCLYRLYAVFYQWQIPLYFQYYRCTSLLSIGLDLSIMMPGVLYHRPQTKLAALKLHSQAIRWKWAKLQRAKVHFQKTLSSWIICWSGKCRSDASFCGMISEHPEAWSWSNVIHDANCCCFLQVMLSDFAAQRTNQIAQTWPDHNL